MKILIDLTSLADNFSGIERYAACLTEEMIAETSYSFILIFKNEVHSMFKKYVNNKNIEMKVIPGCNKLLFNQIKLPFAIQKCKADCYLFMAFPVPILLLKKNMISTIHDICCWDCPETMNGLSNWYFIISHRIALLKCKNIITISKFSKNRIANKLRYSKDKIWLIYCGIDKKFLMYKNNTEKYLIVKEKYRLPNKYLLSLSTLEPRKNIKLLVKAYCELVEENKIDYPLVLAGRKGWKMDSLLDEIPNKIKNNILFTGFIDDDDLAFVYGNAELFIFPSMYEGFGMPPLEAIACGTRVLSSDSSSLPEILGKSSLYFKNNNIDDLKKQLLFALKNKDCICRKEKEEQISKFVWKSEAYKLLDDLKEIV